MDRDCTQSRNAAQVFTPRSYQKIAIDFLMSRDKAALFLDMGMGKTASVLMAITFRIFVTEEVKHVLIVAPPLVAETTWRDEIAKWTAFQNLTHVFVGGTAKQRREALRKDVHIYTISCDNFVWLAELVRGNFGYFDMVVIDESSKFKNPAAKKSLVMNAAKNLVRFMVLLTGTPAPNGMLDLWQQVALVNDRILEDTFKKYQAKYFLVNKYNPYSYDIKEGAEAEILHRIAPYALSMKTEDFPELQLKDAQYITISIPYTDKEMEAYQAFERDAYFSFISDTEVELQGVGEEPKRIEIVANNKAALYNKLLQYTSGRIYDDEREVHKIHDKKLDRLVEMVEEFQGEPALIAYSYKHERDAIMQRVKGAEVKTTQGDFVKRWNEGKIRALALHPASAGHGLNIQDGGRFIIWSTPTWNLELYLQLNKRLHRQGQKKVVNIYHLVTPGTIDELVMARVQSKDERQDRIFEALKRKYQ